MSGPRWPVEALHEAGFTAKQLRRVLGGSGYKDALERGLTDRRADTISVRLGLHPLAVWGWAWVDAGLGVLDRDYLDGGWRQAWLYNERSAA